MNGSSTLTELVHSSAAGANAVNPRCRWGWSRGTSATCVWPHEHHGEPALEAGWSVEAEYRGQGIAPAAVVAMLEHARAAAETPPVHAYPRVDNPASNAVCRKAGFTLLGEEDFEVKPGRVLHTNDWVVELTAAPRA